MWVHVSGIISGKYSWCTQTPFKRSIYIPIQIYKLLSFDEKPFQFDQQIVILLRSKEKEKNNSKSLYYTYVR